MNRNRTAWIDSSGRSAMRLTTILGVGLVAIFFSATIARAESIPVVSVSQNANGITLKMKPGVMKLEVWSDRIIRVQYTDQDELPATASLAVIGTPENMKWKYAELANEERITTALIQARVNRQTGAVVFYDLRNRPILAEVPEGGKSFHSGREAIQTFKLGQNEAIYGLGQHQAGLMNYTGTNVHLQQAN